MLSTCIRGFCHRLLSGLVSIMIKSFLVSILFILLTSTSYSQTSKVGDINILLLIRILEKGNTINSKAFVEERGYKLKHEIQYKLDTTITIYSNGKNSVALCSRDSFVRKVTSGLNDKDFASLLTTITKDYLLSNKHATSQGLRLVYRYKGYVIVFDKNRRVKANNVVVYKPLFK